MDRQHYAVNTAWRLMTISSPASKTSEHFISSLFIVWQCCLCKQFS